MADAVKLPSKRTVLIEVSVGVVLSLLFYYKFHKPIVATIVISISSLVAIGGLAVPPLYAAIKRFGLFLGKFLAGFMTWILLVPFFYVCFSIGRIGLVFSRKDPMHRRYDASLATYWTKRKQIDDLEQYRRQY